MNTEKLLKTVTYLRDLPEHLFNFKQVRVANAPVSDKHTSCGTVGCVIGHLPDIFPGEVMWDGKKVRALRTIRISKNFVQCTIQS